MEACVIKSWEKYAIHIIEPVLKLIGHDREIVETKVLSSEEGKTVLVKFDDDLVVNFKTLGSRPAPTAMRVYGDAGYQDLRFAKTTYASFKGALQHFINTILKNETPPAKVFVMKSVEIIEKGLR